MSETANFLKKIGRRVNFKKDDLIFREGDKSDSFFYITKGEIEIFTKRYAEKNILAILKKGDILGEMSLFEASPRSAGARAIDDAVLLKVSKNNFYKFLKKEPKKAFVFSTDIVKIISKRLRTANSYLASLFDFSLYALRIKTVDELASLILDKIVFLIPGITKCLFYVWNQFNEEFEYLKGRGEISDGKAFAFSRYDESEIIKKLGGKFSFAAAVGEEQILGCIYIQKKNAFQEEEKVLLRTLLHLSSPLILDLWHREEEENIKRLEKFVPFK